LLTKLKTTVEAWIRYEASIAHKAGFKPNHISLLSLTFGLASSFAYWLAGSSMPNLDFYRIYLISAFLLLLLSGFCDALDGALARLYGEITTMGGFLDSLLDRYVEATLFCGLMLSGLCDTFWGLLALVGSLLTSYARARSEAADVYMEKVGIFERAERLLLILVATLLNIFWFEALRYSVIILAFATNFTVLQRLYHFSKIATKR